MIEPWMIWLADHIWILLVVGFWAALMVGRAIARDEIWRDE